MVVVRVVGQAEISVVQPDILPITVLTLLFQAQGEALRVQVLPQPGFPVPGITPEQQSCRRTRSITPRDSGQEEGKPFPTSGVPITILSREEARPFKVAPTPDLQRVDLVIRQPTADPG